MNASRPSRDCVLASAKALSYTTEILLISVDTGFLRASESPMALKRTTADTTNTPSNKTQSQPCGYVSCKLLGFPTAHLSHMASWETKSAYKQKNMSENFNKFSENDFWERIRTYQSRLKVVESSFIVNSVRFPLAMGSLDAIFIARRLLEDASSRK